MLSRKIHLMIIATLVAAFFAVFAGTASAGGGYTVVTPMFGAQQWVSLPPCGVMATISPFGWSVGWENTDAGEPIRSGDHVKMQFCAGNNIGKTADITFSTNDALHHSQHTVSQVPSSPSPNNVAEWQFRTHVPAANTTCAWSGTRGFAFPFIITGGGYTGGSAPSDPICMAFT
jgi:hypothetical protein